jgi:hypothetical protein
MKVVLWDALHYSLAHGRRINLPLTAEVLNVLFGLRVKFQAPLGLRVKFHMSLGFRLKFQVFLVSG